MFVGVSDEAQRQLDNLLDHYEEENRPEAAVRLSEAFSTARRLIGFDPHTGYRAPRPYPVLARLGFRWLLTHRYWIAWDMQGDTPVIVQVHYDQSDIPARFGEV